MILENMDLQLTALLSIFNTGQCIVVEFTLCDTFSDSQFTGPSIDIVSERSAVLSFPRIRCQLCGQEVTQTKVKLT